MLCINRFWIYYFYVPFLALIRTKILKNEWFCVPFVDDTEWCKADRLGGQLSTLSSDQEQCHIRASRNHWIQMAFNLNVMELHCIKIKSIRIKRNERKWNRRKQDRIYLLVLEVIRVSISCVYLCVCFRDPKNLYTCSDLLEGLSVLRSSCAHSYILLTGEQMD